MIGKNIKYYRLMRGMSQEALAQQIGLNKMAVARTCSRCMKVEMACFSCRL
ncbi:MAG TPA: helix-turn-helix transcriptional regulator [Candidatus Alectryocaccomicrobium excrementavium]|uniref:Helix-turn-helix transcriptional regulator n=1 Tax=Candidatus Alectryocaccomicrobium excrementavium TaxID=2840668 RepID=A0A9D1FZ60_9FIRM|nr:helix-turn-helix transcriptional regulator [Candidatus Alectryocaccomicrobium excrementavium]